MAVFDDKEVAAVVFAASCFFPEFNGLHGRKEDFGGADGVHFFADEVFGFAKRA